MENVDPFESQLKEILDSGPVNPNPAPTPESDPAAVLKSSTNRKRQSGSLVEIIIRIAALIAVVGLLIGFAMRVTSF